VSIIGAAQEGPLQARVAALKQSLAESRQQLKQYQWTETMTVIVNGEEKSHKQYECHYGPDGTVQKVLLEASPEKTGRGLRGRIIKKKKEEMTDYMRRAADLVKMYVPPTPDKIQATAAAGNAAVEIQPGRHVRLRFKDYEKPGDMLAVELDATSNRLLGATVDTYLDSPRDGVGLTIQFGTLADGTIYPSDINLSVEAKNLTVRVTNSDYRKIGG
jgi:hypothetical protein